MTPTAVSRALLRSTVTFLFCISGLTTTNDCRARTIRVSAAGDAEFSVLHEATAAAAPGDTVLIAPGTYSQLTPWGDQIDQAIGIVSVENLTILAEEPGTVTLDPGFVSPRRVGLGVDWNGSLRVRGIRFWRCVPGIDSRGGAVDVADCVFDGIPPPAFWSSGVSIYVYEGQCTIRDTSFNASENFISNLTPESVLFDNVHVVGGTTEVKGGGVFRNSTFNSHTLLVRDGLYEVSACHFTDASDQGLYISDTSKAHVVDCEFRGSMSTSIECRGAMSGTRNVLAAGRGTTLRLTTRVGIEFHGNHILNAGAYSARVLPGYGAGGVVHRLDGNYWGTTDLAVLEEWIVDGLDETLVPTALIQFLPIAEVAIPTEKKSFGSLKAEY